MSNETPRIRLNPPYRAEHLGSFVRPPNLIDARDGWREGSVGAEALRALEDASIREIVAMQERVGLRVVSDGEFRKWSWRDLLFDAADGFTASREPSDFSFTDYSGKVSRGMPVPDVTAKIRRREPMAAGMPAATSVTVRRAVVTMLSPSGSSICRRMCSSSSTTPNAPEASSRCAICRSLASRSSA